MSVHGLKVKLYNSSSSSEDEEENRRLLSAVWQDNAHYPSRKSKETNSGVDGRQTTVLSKPSIRRQVNADYHDQFNEDHKNVMVTPEFRTFVAKKLTAILDRSIDTTAVTTTSFRNGEQDEADEGGFKLLSSSCGAPLTASSTQQVACVRKKPYIGRKKRKDPAGNNNDGSDSEAEDQRLAEAAVSGHQILMFAMLAASHQSVNKSESATEECCDPLRSKQSRSSDSDDVVVKRTENTNGGVVKKTRSKKSKKLTEKHIKESSEICESNKFCQVHNDQRTDGNAVSFKKMQKKSKQKETSRDNVVEVCEEHAAQSDKGANKVGCVEARKKKKKKKTKGKRAKMTTGVNETDDQNKYFLNYKSTDVHDNVREVHQVKKKKKRRAIPEVSQDPLWL